jgi:tRNA pseudouridine synthase 10
MRQAVTRAIVNEALRRGGGSSDEAINALDPRADDDSALPEAARYDILVSDDDDEVVDVVVNSGTRTETNDDSLEAASPVFVLPRSVDVADAFRCVLLRSLDSESAHPANGANSARATHDQDAPFRYALLFQHGSTVPEAGFALRMADENSGKDQRNRKKRGPPPQLNLATLPEPPAARWQRINAAYNVSAKFAAERLFSLGKIVEAVKRGDACVEAAFEAIRRNIYADEKKTETRCTCAMVPWHRPSYLGGRYLKWARGVPQSPWFADGGVVGEGSVQQSLEKFVVQSYRADGCKLNSAGREDMDVRMLGGGRPFILEVHNPRRPSAFESDEERKAMETSLANEDDGVVTAVNVHPVDRAQYVKMHEGSAEKRKTYTAVCWADKFLTESDLKTLSRTAAELTIQQKTPTRVLHRRTSSTRPRVIHACEAYFLDEKTKTSKFFILELTAQAGTYVKEFVHGDFGRTSPSVCEILQREADILQLDVTDIVMEFGGSNPE